MFPSFLLYESRCYVIWYMDTYNCHILVVIWTFYPMELSVMTEMVSALFKLIK